MRIGDFGLARPGDYQTAPKSSGETIQSRESFGSFTKDVGTAFYVAPEVRSGNGKYNGKADMFSLGIVLLEMNVAFATGMERIETLTKLQKDGHLPPILDNKVTQAKIITSLLQSQPSHRPSSAELLDGGDIPAQAEDDSLRMARRLLVDPNSHMRSLFINNLFSGDNQTTEAKPTPAFRDPVKMMVLLDDLKAMSRTSSHDLALQRMVEDKLTRVFELHGNVKRTDNPPLFPYHSYYALDDVVKFLGPSGTIMQLPYDLILPNAMLLAQRTRSERRTFIFDDVYRASPFGNEPKIFGEANFDIVSAGGMNLALCEAEILKVIDEILDAFPNLASVQMCYHINHSRILDGVLAHCNIESTKFAAVKEIISKLHTGDWTWAKVRHELRNPSVAVASVSLDELERFDFRDSLEKATSRIRSIIRNTISLESAFAHLNLVATYLIRLKVRRKVYFNPLSSYNEKFYRENFLFQCLYDQKKRSVLAAGGRYDALIRDHQPIASSKSRVHAVGFQLAWTGLCADMSAYLKRLAKSKSKRRIQASINAASYPSRCEVLVDSFDYNLLDSVGLDILLELQGNQISAKLAEPNDGDTKENNYLRDDFVQKDYNWEVVITSQDFVRVRDVSQNDETEVRISELAAHMRNEIRERNRQRERTSRMAFVRQESQQDSDPIFKDREVEIKVLTSQNKGKKVNRKTIIEEGRVR